MEESELKQALYKRIIELEYDKYLPLSETMYDNKIEMIKWNIDNKTFHKFGYTIEFSNDYKSIRKISLPKSMCK